MTVVWSWWLLWSYNNSGRYDGVAVEVTVASVHMESVHYRYVVQDVIVVGYGGHGVITWWMIVAGHEMFIT